MKRSGRSLPASLAFALALLGAPEGLALDPGKAITQYHLDLWGERDGLPQGSVQAITQTRDGYLWVGTRDGLARFDGVSFTVFHSERYPGLGSDDIRVLREDRAGDLWIGTFNGGLSRYRGGQFTRFEKTDGLPGSGVLEITEDGQGAVWIGCWDGLARYEHGKFTSYGVADGVVGRNVWSLCPDRQGRVWMATESAVHRFADDGFVLPSLHGRARVADLRKILFDSRGVLCTGSLGGGLGRFQDGLWTDYTSDQGLADDKVNTLLEDRHGNLWIGTWAGLSRFQNGRITSLSKQNGLAHDFVQALFEDREGSLWIGTRGGGLGRLTDGKFSVYTTREGLANDFIKCIKEARDGTIWIGTHGGGLSGFRDGRFTTFTIEDGLPSNCVSSIGEDQNGAIWLGTRHPAGLASLSHGRITPVSLPGFPLRHGIRALFADRQNTLWIGMDGGGLARYRDGACRVYRREDGLPSNLVRLIAQDREGTLWIGTNDGLCRRRGDQFDVFTTRNGLAHNAVYALHEDHQGALWFGTQGGLSRYRNGRFSSYTPREGLLSDLIYQVLEDRRGNLWMSCNRGIFSLAKQNVADFDSGRVPRLSCVGYGVADGMKTSQCAGGSEPAGWASQAGQLWFPTLEGVVVVDPEKIVRNETTPPVLIEKAIAGTEELDLTHPARLGPGTRELKFQYTALSLAAPEKVRFRYRLEGLNESWVEAGARRVAFYNHLPPGRYHFRVTACNNDGVWNESGAGFAFLLRPHFYQTGWFYAVCVLAAGLFAWSLHRIRMRRAKAEFAAILTERNRIARELHDTLAQGFAGIAFQLEAVAARLTEAPAAAKQHLALALQMVRHSLAEARRSVLNLRSGTLENGDLAAALAETARQLMAGQDIEFQVHTVGAPRALPAKIEDNLLRIGQEAITNAFKHARAGRIQVGVTFEPDRVLLEVRDDGCGFQYPGTPRFNGAHFGLLGMRERARQMSADLQISTSPGGGTGIRVAAPTEGVAETLTRHE